jgi:hypothetical protein
LNHICNKSLSIFSTTGNYITDEEIIKKVRSSYTEEIEENEEILFLLFPLFLTDILMSSVISEITDSFSSLNIQRNLT